MGLCLVAMWNVWYQPDSASPRLSSAQMLAILQTHCPTLRQQPDVLGCLPVPSGIRLITDRPALMPTHVAGLPVVTELPPPHLPPPPGVIILQPDGPDPRPQLDQCPSGYRELQQYRWRFCNSTIAPQPIPTELMSPPIAGVPYTDAKKIFKRQDFIQLPGVQSVGLEADGIVVRTTQPALIPSTFEGLSVRIQEPQGDLRPASHTLTEVPSSLQGGVAIGESIGDSTSTGTLGGFVWSGGEPWLVSAAHNFPSKCGKVPPCSSGKLLHQCPHEHTSGISAKLAPRSASPSTVSTLTRWTQLSGTVKADAAAGWVDVDDYTLNRGLTGFSKMVTGDYRDPMIGDSITLISAYGASHVNTGMVSATMKGAIMSAGVCDSGGAVTFQEMFDLKMDNSILDGTSGGLVIDGTGNILGMFSFISVGNSRLGVAVKASNIKTALNFEKWVGSKTVPVEGNLVSVGRQNNSRPTLRGWASDPLNPKAPLKVEVYVDGKQGTGTKVNWGTTTDPIWTITADKAHTGMSGTEKLTGQHGIQEWLPPQYSTSPFYLYALAPGDTTGFLLKGSPLTPTWPTGHQAINPRDGDLDENSKPRRIAISVTNDEEEYPPTNYPVHPNAKKAVDEVLKVVWQRNTTPAITSININSTLRAPTGEPSAHIDGRAIDINEINGTKVKCAHVDFAAHDDCKGLSAQAKMDIQTWVTTLQDTFLADCRVKRVLGPVDNKNKWANEKGENPHEVTHSGLIKKHRDHIHIAVWRTGKSTCKK